MAITKIEIFNSSDDSLIKEIDNPPIVQYNGKDTIQPKLDNVVAGTLSIYYKVYKDSVLDFTSGVFSFFMVNTPPTSSAKSFNIHQDGILIVDAQNGVLSNASDVDGDAITAELVSDVNNGALDFASDGSFNYVPNPGYFGSDSFSYKPYDGKDYGSVVQVTISVSEVTQSNIIKWTDKVNTIANDDTGLIKAGFDAGSGFEDGAYATRAINGDNAILFKFKTGTDSFAIIGVTNTYNGLKEDSFDMDLIVFQGNNKFTIRENGNIEHTEDLVNDSDLISINLTGSTVSVQLNGNTIYTSAATFTLPLAPISIVRNYNGVKGQISEASFENTNNLIQSHLLTTDIQTFNINDAPSAIEVGTDTVLESLYWPEVHKSSDWPEINTTKPYFILYSSDHGNDPSTSGVAWGEFDSFLTQPDGFTLLENFVERGLIFTDGQIETPRLLRVPTSRSGINEELFLYVHTSSSHPDVPEGQQTILFTSIGGDLHTANWTPRGNVLGPLLPGENHLGYLSAWWDTDQQLYIGKHSYNGQGDDTFHGKISKSPDGINWTRGKTVNNDSWTGAPPNRTFNKLYTFPFTYKGVRYAVLSTSGNPIGSGVGIATLDADYAPDTYVATILNTETTRDLGVFFEAGKMHIFLTQYIGSDISIITFDLKILDRYI